MVELIFKEEFFKIKEACITVRKELGNGFLEKVYENSPDQLGFEIERVPNFIEN